MRQINTVEYNRSNFCDGLTGDKCPLCGNDMIVFEATVLVGAGNRWDGKRPADRIECEICGYRE